MNNEVSAADALAQARSGPDMSYDAIGFRWQSAVPMKQTPLCTLDSELEAERRHPVAVQYVGRLREGIKALSFGLDFPDGYVRYHVNADERQLHLSWTNESGQKVERRTTLADPPNNTLDGAEDLDASASLSRRLPGGDTSVRWIPFGELLERGRFVRMQEWQDGLENHVAPNCYCLFVSHRWLTPDQPDPDGRQAAQVCWQLASHLIEAVWVAAARGRHVPRKRSSIGYAYVGVHGSELAESILVNMLRGLPEAEFETLRAEAGQLDPGTGSFRGSRSSNELHLQELRSRLHGAPATLGLLKRFRIWYDYSCLPQRPRTLEEELEFQLALRQLAQIQIRSRTVVVLDDVAHYFGRAWCTFEAGVGYELLDRALDVWQGSDTSPGEFKLRQETFRRVLLDRAHLVWRGILDTEVFGVQSSDDCMSRLRLATTEPEDRMLVYGLLRDLGCPHSVRFDDSELLTGAFPLPVQGQEAVIVAESGRTLAAAMPVVSSMDAREANTLAPIDARGVEPFEEFDSMAGSISAHIAVLGRCEGEAMLHAQWVRENRHQIGDALGVSVKSMSWLASDIAPVGHFACGNFQVRAAQADVWIAAGAGATLLAGYAASLLKETASAAGMEYVEFHLGTSVNNVRRHPATHGNGEAKSLRRLELSDPAITAYPGGLLVRQLMPKLGARP